MNFVGNFCVIHYFNIARMKRILILIVALCALQSAMAGGPLDKKRVKTTTTKSKAEKSDFDKAVELYAADQVDEAYTLFLKEMKKADHKGYAATYIGSMMADADEMDAALSYLQQAEGNIPAKDSAFLAFFHGEMARVKATNPDATAEVLQHFQKAIDLQPDDAFYYERRGKFHQKLEHYGEAEADCHRAATLAPDDMGVQISWGCALDANNQFDEALKVFNIVVGKWGDQADAYAYRASTLYNMAQYASATDDAIRALEIDGENRHALWLLPYLKAQDAEMVMTKLKVKQAANPEKWDAVIAEL